MIYLAWYLGIGGVVLVAVYAAHRLGGGGALNSKSELLDALHPERKTLRYRILSGVVVPALSAVAVVVGWPIAVGLKLKELLTRWSRGRVSGAEGFVVRETDLERSFTIAEIEDDVLAAAP